MPTRSGIDPMVEGSLSWSLLEPDDLPALVELRMAIEYFDDPIEREGAEELSRFLAQAQAEATRNAVVGRDRAGTVVAYAWNHPEITADNEPRVWLDGGIHPAWRHQDIGMRLLEWQINRALSWDAEHREPSWSDLWMGRHVDLNADGLSELLLRSQFTPERWYFDMRAWLGVNQTDPSPDPDGIRIVAYTPEYSEQVRLAHNEAFTGVVGSHPVDEQAWRLSLTRPESRPEWSWVALAGQECVGYALSSILQYEDEAPEGWTDRLGVRHAWRRRGIAAALLRASMSSFRAAGCQAAGLGIDTDQPESALKLYGALGYQPEDMVVLYGRRFGRTEREHHPVFE